VHVASWIEASTRKLAVPSVKQRLDIDRRAVVGGAAGAGEEGTVVAGIVPGKAALVMGLLPEVDHELDRLDGRLAVEHHGLAVRLDLLAAP